MCVCLSVHLLVCLHLSVCPFVCLSMDGSIYSVCLVVCPSVCLSVFLSGCPSVCLSVCLSLCLSVCLSVRLSVHLSVCLSICLFVGMSICLSVCSFICLSVCLFVCVSAICLFDRLFICLLCLIFLFVCHTFVMLYVCRFWSPSIVSLHTCFVLTCSSSLDLLVVESKRSNGIAAVWVARNRFTVLDRQQQVSAFCSSRLASHALLQPFHILVISY